MRIQRWLVLTGASVLTLALVALPSVWGQARTGSAPAVPPAAAAASPAQQPAVPPAPAEAPQALPDCGVVVGTLPADLQLRIKSIQRELESKMKGLEDKIAREVAQVETEKLSGLGQEVNSALEGRQAELESRVGDAAALAGEIAAQEAAPQAWVFDAGEESGWVGVEIAEVTADKAKELKLPSVRGALVVEVEPDSPAAKAGLKSGDVITEYDRQAVEGVVQFRRLVGETPPGRPISLTVWRDGSSQNLTVEVSSRSHAMALHVPRAFGGPMPHFDFNMQIPDFIMGSTPMLGINAEDLTGQLGAYFGAPSEGGILVRDVRSGTPAEKAGLKAGDVIVKVDDQTVRTVNELRQQLREKREQKSVKLGVIRKGSPVSVTVELEQSKHIEHRHVTRRAVL
jgi:serine protease Do